MSVQRYHADVVSIHAEGWLMSVADHARIVAEAGAAVFAFHPEWTVTGMCDSDCLACRRLTELITEREKGYEEGKADAEQAHAAALAEEYRRWRKAAEDVLASWPRTLTADDPEPAVGSVVLFDGLPYIRQGNKWVAPRANSAYWYEFMRDERPTVLIHDGGAA